MAYHPQEEQINNALIHKNMNNLKVGDIIVDRSGNEAKVLAVLGEVFLRSFWDNFDEAVCWNTFKEVEIKGWKLKTSKDTEIAAAIKLLEAEGKLVNGKILNL